MKRVIVSIFLVAAAAAGGCDNTARMSAVPPAPVDKIDNVGLRISPPMPLNWDDTPGVDGLQAEVNLFRISEPLSVPVRGKLEFSLYEGQSSAQILAGKEPFHKWTFDGEELQRHLGRSVFGWGYAMRLGWGEHRPKATSVTLIAYYRATDGTGISSQPLHVAMVPK